MALRMPPDSDAVDSTGCTGGGRAYEGPARKRTHGHLISARQHRGSQSLPGLAVPRPSRATIGAT